MSAIAARYARALADVLREAHADPAAAQTQLNDFLAAWNIAADLREVLLDPSFPVSDKIAILDRLNGKLGMMQQVRNFVAVLISHNRLHALREIVAEFHQVVDGMLGVSEVAITSARALGQQERSDLEQQVAGLTGSKVRATYSEDASLLGGVIVRVGSTVYDGSVRGRLDRLRQELIAG